MGDAPMRASLTLLSPPHINIQCQQLKCEGLHPISHSKVGDLSHRSISHNLFYKLWLYNFFFILYMSVFATKWLVPFFTLIHIHIFGKKRIYIRYTVGHLFFFPTLGYWLGWKKLLKLGPEYVFNCSTMNVGALGGPFINSMNCCACGLQGSEGQSR